MNEETRPAVSAELRRRILTEAGHRCAIPTCRYIEVEVHHIIPWEQCRTHEYENLIALCPNCHARADRGEMDRKSLRIYKANLRFAHEKFSQFEIDFLFDLEQKSRKEERSVWPTYMNMLIKRLLDAEYVQISKLKTMVYFGPNNRPAPSLRSGDIKLSPDEIRITEKGKAFIQSLSYESQE